VAGGFVFWKLRADKIDELDEICPSPDECPPDESSAVDSAESSGRLTHLGIGLWGVSAAAIHLLLGSSNGSSSAELVPALSPNVAGAELRGSF
jgi:hypothetical protein